MVDRDPKLKKFAKGEDGGPRNPLGSRAMYLWSGNVDTLYRIHGTNDPLSIGKAVSSGCVRMLDQDVIDLYERVPLRTKVIVLGTAGTTPLADIMQQQQDTLPIKARPTAADKTKG
jgi:lipoprotein-anchoring transpeptidase ErfK/SrfK